MSKFALFSTITTLDGDCVRLVGFTASESVANSWAKQEWCITDTDEEYYNYSSVLSVSRRAVQVPSDEPLYLQRTVNAPHDGNGYSEGLEVVTYEQYLANRRSFRRHIKRDHRGYREGRYNGYALDGNSISESPTITECRDHKGGRFTLSLDHEIVVIGNRFELQPPEP